MSNDQLARMKPRERHVWIREWIQKKGGVDVLNVEFVNAYSQATGAPVVAMGFGADRCKQLGRDLSEMFRDGRLERSRIGLADHYSGMPNWVYVYDLQAQ